MEKCKHCGGEIERHDSNDYWNLLNRDIVGNVFTCMVRGTDWNGDNHEPYTKAELVLQLIDEINGNNSGNNRNY